MPGGLFERVEAAAQECDHRVDRSSKVGGALRLLLRASAPLGQDVEGGGEGGGDDLWTNVVRGRVEVLGDRRGDQLLELGDPGSQMVAQGLVAFDADAQLLVNVALLDSVHGEDELTHCLDPHWTSRNAAGSSPSPRSGSPSTPGDVARQTAATA